MGERTGFFVSEMGTLPSHFGKVASRQHAQQLHDTREQAERIGLEATRNVAIIRGADETTTD